MSSHLFYTSKWCFNTFPFSAWSTAIWLYETASGFSSTMGLTTQHPSIVLYAHGPSCWLGMTSNGWMASTQFAPFNKSTLMLAFCPRKLDISSKHCHCFSLAGIAISLWSTGIPSFVYDDGNFIHFWYLSASSVSLQTLMPSRMWINCLPWPFSVWCWYMFLFLLYQGPSSIYWSRMSLDYMCPTLQIIWPPCFIFYIIFLLELHT